MSHRCGSNCYRKRDMRSQCPSCARQAQKRRNTITAGGRERRLLQSVLENKHPEISKRDISYVLGRWKIRGVWTDDQGRQSWNYYAMVPRLGRVVRVAVSLDDSLIVSVFIDRNATVRWRRRELSWFTNRLSRMEHRRLKWD